MDAELALRELKRAGHRVAHRTVDSEHSYTSAFREFAPDVILSDFSMPGFDGMEALRLAQAMSPETPFIFVSGTLGEDYAIRAVKNGATDYVLKSNLLRLPAAVERALAEAKLRRERVRAEIELAISQERLREREAGLARAQLLAGLGHVITGRDGRFESWSDTLPEIIGVMAASMPGSTREWLELIHPEDRARFRATSIEAGAAGGRADIEYRLCHASGRWLHVRQVMEPLPAAPNANGGTRWFNTIQDITHQKLAEARIKRLNRVYAVLSGINALIVRATDRQQLFQEACRIAVEAGQLRMAWIGLFDRKTSSIVPAACHGHEDGFLRLISLSSDDPAPEGRGLVRRAVREKRTVIVNDIENDPKFRLRKEAIERGYRSAAVLPLTVAGELVGVLSLLAPEPGFFDEDEMRLLTELAGDISFAVDHIQKVEKLDYLAYYDGLTGLANRTLLLERLAQYLQGTDGARGQLAVVVCDLERFRTVNDSLGRAAGDLLLSQFAKRLLEHADANRVARLGADHFAIVLPDVKGELDTAKTLGELSERCLRAPLRIADQELRLSAKGGIALFPGHGQDAESLLRNAEAALKRCKRGGERYLFYRPDMTDRAAQSLSLENQLRRALELEEFVLHYQPRVDLPNRRIQGLEALIRWQSKDGLVPPIKFIPLLEETGLILEVGAWALRHAVLEHRGWLDRGIRAPRLAVNVSAVQLRQRDFVSRVKRALEGGAIPPGVDLEITESMLMDDIADNIDKLRAVRDLGIDIAIDDFGTGYSSLGYLAKLPVTTLKIDRSFIITMLGDPSAMTLVSTMISLARALKLKVVAEGVDSEEQAQALGRLQCDEMQGYLYSKPLPSSDLIRLLGNA